MTERIDAPSPRESLRRELETTRQSYHELLAAIPDNAWQRSSANSAWTVRQMMYHITLALRFLPADIALLRRGHTPYVPPRLFDLVNEWYTRFAGSRQTRQSLAATYDRHHETVLRLLDSIEPHEWSLRGEYPAINRNLQGTQTIASMFHYIAVHFEEHAADIRPVLEAANGQSMPQSGGHPRAPLGTVGRVLFRAPLLLYRLGLGWLLGGRFLRLHHIGRKSGLPRQALLEVVDHDQATDTYYVASGFGRGSQWFKNVQANPQVTIQVGPRRLLVTAEVLSPDASADKMVDYAHHYPTAARGLARVLGLEVDGSEETYRKVAREHIPFVAFHPVRVLRERPTTGEVAAPLVLVLAVLLLLYVVRRRRR